MLWGSVLVLGMLGCQTVRPLPPANLKEPGWTVHQGQAVWKLPHQGQVHLRSPRDAAVHQGQAAWKLPQGAREVAGDVLVATRPDGRALVQFSVSPFTLVSAQENAHQWEVEFPPQNKHYAGRGAPPQRVIWLYLPRVLLGQPPPKGWTWHQDSSGWRLGNPKTGESLEGFFTQ